MAVRTSRLLALSSLAVLAASPLAAHAQTAQFYTPPKLLKQGATSTPTTGAGAVTVQVFVKRDGTIGTTRVVKSTNHGDDAAALEIARSSNYKPGLKDGKPGDYFYTMKLRFARGSGGVVNDTGTSSNQLLQANALIRANKFSDAKTTLQSYLSSHPSDKDAQALLGVSDAYLNDSTGAAAAFDAAGTVPDRFKVVAAKAYADAAVDALKAKNNDQAIAFADKALALQVNVNTLFIRGTAYANAQKYTQAIGDLEKAKAQATGGHADTATLNAIDSSLVTAYLFGGQPDKGLALAQDVKRRDPSNTRVDDAIASYYNQQAAAAVKAGRKADAVAMLDKAAQSTPAQAPVLYVEAANLLAQGDKPDWKAVKAEADKALAINASDPHANYVAGIALANQSDTKNAIVYLQKAKSNAPASDTQFNADIDTALKKLGAAK